MQQLPSGCQIWRELLKPNYCWCSYNNKSMSHKFDGIKGDLGATGSFTGIITEQNILLSIAVKVIGSQADPRIGVNVLIDETIGPCAIVVKAITGATGSGVCAGNVSKDFVVAGF